MEEKRLRNYTTQMDAARKGIVTQANEDCSRKGTYDDRCS